MKKTISLFLFSVSIVLCQYEIIPISQGLSTETADRLWPTFKSGAITINEQEIIIPDGSSLYIQRRSAPFDYTTINLKRSKKDYFTVYEATANKELFAYTVVGSDGRFYIFERKRKTGEVRGPELRQGISAARLFLLDDNKLVATGIYRPELLEYLELYNKGSIEEQRKNRKQKFDGLYLNHKAYTLSVYDQSLTEIDSGNVIDRTGDNARAHEGLYLSHPVDIAKNNVLYLIDNDQGYVVEKYTDLTRFSSRFKINNKNFINLPDVMSLNDMETLRSKDRAYSVPYALYEKDGYLLTCFFQAPVRFEKVRPMYFYDISTVKGELLYSGKLEYPFLCEDDQQKVFIYVTIEGGWFEDDNHFLVGVTVPDLLSGQVNKSTVDMSISKFREE